jgi:hypothetical protein
MAPDRAALPSAKRVVRDQLVVISDFFVPRRHRLLDELAARRADISGLLQLPTSDEPINIYLFEDSERFRHFMFEQHPEFADRRAYFVKNDITLEVFAFWGDRVGEDLRHEVTHGYLHSVVPDIPLWLDEGLAEYFEVPRGKSGFNAPHVYLLAERFRRDAWAPDLGRLETLTDAALLEQVDYAESWLWVHFLIEHSEESRFLLQHHLARTRITGSAEPLSERISHLLPDAEHLLVEHLRRLATRL